MSRGIRAGVIGIGSLGREHTRIYSSIEAVSSLTLFDMIGDRAEEAAARYGASVASSPEELLEACDVASVCTPATDHFGSVSKAFERGVHVLVEKPIAAGSADGEKLVKRAADAGCILQVGHIERFNGAFQAALPLLKKPMFIESHRLGLFTPRGTDVSVVVDLMIHDLDIVLTVMRGRGIVDLRASGTGVLTDSPDIVNARLEFEGGCVANLTASRISREPLRKIRFFEENLYVSVDLREKSVEAFRKARNTKPESLESDPMAFVSFVPVEVDRGEPLRKEIESFIDSVTGGKRPAVTGEQSVEALRLAERILGVVT